MERLTDEQSKIASDNVALVHYIAKRFFRRYQNHFDDLVSVGNFALMSSATRYDASRGRISTLAFKSIMRAMWQYLSKEKAYSPGGRVPLSDQIAPAERMAFEDTELIKKALEGLSDKEQTVLLLRTQGLQLAPIGQIFGLSRERIRQIQQIALAKCRRNLAGLEAADVL